MAYFKISTDKKGKLKAKIQALGRDPETDKQKVCYKLVKNDNDLTPAKFHKYVEKCAIPVVLKADGLALGKGAFFYVGFCFFVIIKRFVCRRRNAIFFHQIL